jgi:hypothetical protein
VLKTGKYFEKSLCWLHVTQKTNEISTSAQISSSEMLQEGELGYQFVQPNSLIKASVVSETLFLLD